MSVSANLLRIIPTLQSAALLKRNVKFLEKKNVKPKKLVEQSVENIVGTMLIQENSKFLLD